MCFFRVYSLYPAYAGNGISIRDVTAQSIYGIRGVNNDATSLQAVNYLLHVPRLRVVGVYVDEHRIKLVNKHLCHNSI